MARKTGGKEKEWRHKRRERKGIEGRGGEGEEEEVKHLSRSKL